jgi:hypothetical protein
MERIFVIVFVADVVTVVVVVVNTVKLFLT